MNIREHLCRVGNHWGMRPALPPSAAIAADIRAKIESGQLPAGAQLPTVDRLMVDYGVSRGTVAKALGILKDEGLIVTRHGWGTHVAEPGGQG